MENRKRIQMICQAVEARLDPTSYEFIFICPLANQIAEAIEQAQNETELPRSLLGLQTHLQECIDDLLVYARRKTLAELIR